MKRNFAIASVRINGEYSKVYGTSGEVQKVFTEAVVNNIANNSPYRGVLYYYATQAEMMEVINKDIQRLNDVPFIDVNGGEAVAV